MGLVREGVVIHTVRATTIFSAAIGILLLTVAGALADVIDGHWCTGDGRRLVIDGEMVTTPAGLKITGEYDGHHYLFKMPPHELRGGKRVDLVLVSENIMHARYHSGLDEGGNAAPEVWKRCKEPVSSLPRRRYSFASDRPSSE